jgi:hypothetical protein
MEPFDVTERTPGRLARGVSVQLGTTAAKPSISPSRRFTDPPDLATACAALCSAALLAVETITGSRRYPA